LITLGAWNVKAGPQKLRLEVIVTATASSDHPAAAQLPQCAEPYTPLK
jgi:hypothetical protein